MTRAQLKAALLQRVGEIVDPSETGTFFTEAEAVSALDAAQRMFAFLTLCLESEGSLLVVSGTVYYSPMSTFSDWIVPLRVRTSTGAKVRPVSLVDLDAKDPTWETATGAVERYASLGANLLAFYKTQDATLTVTYARSPAALSSDAAVPEIPEKHHPALVDGALAFLRLKEGSSELAKTMPYFDRFLDAIRQEAAHVRMRNASYDRQPPELGRFDTSKLFKKVANVG